MKVESQQLFQKISTSEFSIRKQKKQKNKIYHRQGPTSTFILPSFDIVIKQEALF